MQILKPDNREKLITFAFFTGIFLPVRLLFYTYISRYWLGSFGLMSAILVLVFYLAKKNKLGRLGGIVIRQTERISKGKLGKAGIITSIFLIYLWGNFIFGIESAPMPLVVQIHNNLESNGITDMETLAEKSKDNQYSWINVAVALLAFISPSDFSHALFHEINRMTDGWALHFATVFLLQEIEFLGIIVYFRHIRKS